MATKDQGTLYTQIDAGLLAQVDEYRFDQRLASRRMAIEQLLRKGLEPPVASGLKLSEDIRMEVAEFAEAEGLSETAAQARLIDSGLAHEHEMQRTQAEQVYRALRMPRITEHIQALAEKTQADELQLLAQILETGLSALGSPTS